MNSKERHLVIGAQKYALLIEFVSSSEPQKFSLAKISIKTLMIEYGLKNDMRIFGFVGSVNEPFLFI